MLGRTPFVNIIHPVPCPWQQILEIMMAKNAVADDRYPRRRCIDRSKLLSSHRLGGARGRTSIRSKARDRIRRNSFPPLNGQDSKRKDTHQRVFPFGAGDEIRTRYLHLGKVALCQMSYARRDDCDYTIHVRRGQLHYVQRRRSHFLTKCLPQRVFLFES